MNRFRAMGVVGSVAIGLVLVGCVPPRPGPPVSPYKVTITRTFVDLSSGFTTVDGTVVNTSLRVLDFDIELKASSGEVSDGFAFNVHPGQGATWSTLFKGRVSAGVVRVQPDTSLNPPVVKAIPKITHLDFDGTYTTVDGTVTNAGPAKADFNIELFADKSGEVADGFAFDVLPGQTATWSTLFLGDVSPRIVRVTS